MASEKCDPWTPYLADSMLGCGISKSGDLVFLHCLSRSKSSKKMQQIPLIDQKRTWDWSQSHLRFQSPLWYWDQDASTQKLGTFVSSPWANQPVSEFRKEPGRAACFYPIPLGFTSPLFLILVPQAWFHWRYGHCFNPKIWLQSLLVSPCSMCW